MSKIYTSPTLLVCLFILISIKLHAQFTVDFQKKLDAEQDKLDLTGIRNGILINKSFFTTPEIDYYRKLQPGNKPNPINSDTWSSLYQRIRKAQIRVNESKFPEINTFFETERTNITKNNIISIGIFNIEGTLLTEPQILDNERKKSLGQVPISTTYEKIHFVGASLLQEDLFQSEVQFRINPDLYFTNRDDFPKTLEIDFGDSNGFQTFEFKQQLITHQFLTLGKHSINIRFQTTEGPYLFESVVNVKQFERKKPFKEFQVTAKAVIQDTTSYPSHAGARITAVPGANVRVVLGCDGVYNKPFIIAEGLDMGEDMSLDDLEALWTGDQTRPMAPYLNQGYDFVFVDYADSKDFIQNNAQVLKAVIREVNNTKVGTSDLVVMGVSMGGLIARYAIREMESQSEVHHVSHMICFDTPHQGANVPVGLIQLYWETPNDVMQNLILQAISKSLYNKYIALTTPAARQMLMHWGGLTNVGVGARHPDFDGLRTALNALGNGGYPANCRNVAMINGSMNATDRRIFDDFNYGNRIMLGWVPGFKKNTMFDIHTNSLNQSDPVMRVSVMQINPLFPIPAFYTSTINYNNPVNDDFMPGGKQEINNRVIGWLSTETFRWSFVPSFSSIDFQGPRATQAQRELLSAGAIAANQTPFDAIYGNLQNLNSTHASPTILPWGGIDGTIGLGDVEGLLSAVGCPAISPPPAPDIFLSTSNCLPFSDYRERHPFDVTINVTPTGPTYRQILRIEKLGSNQSQEAIILAGQSSHTFQIFEVGQYNITCIRSYPGRPDVTSTASAVFNASDCLPPVVGKNATITELDCAGFWENDYLITYQGAPSVHVFAHISDSNVLYASIGENSITGNFVPPATLTSNGMFTEFASCFAASDPRAPLPVVLREFNARNEGKSALLTWSTTSEVNSDRFEIERSIDGKDWGKIGTTKAENSVSGKLDYSYVDKDPTGNLMYYRLKMVDTDESFAYSRIESVRFQDAEVVVYPNPVDSGKQLHLLLNNNNVDQIKIYDLSGKVVYSAAGPTDQINVKGLLVGRYILKIQLKGGSETSHVIVKR